MANPIHAMEVKDVFKALNTTESGLSKIQVEARRKQYGPNKLKEGKKVSPLVIFFRQFNSLIVYILIAATLISLFVGEVVDSIVILLILIANAIFGFIQEYKAEKAIDALKKLSSLKAKVIRSGKIVEVDAVELVPGDILVLEEGDKIPADARLFEIVKMKVEEASLTGESLPTTKQIASVKSDAVLGDQKDMVFSGTIVTYGRGRAIVVNTGMQTEIGKIADMLDQGERSATPLQHKLDVLGRNLGVATIVICLVVFIVGVIRTGNVLEMGLAAIALAVAAVPEGLPAVVTISLALGVQRMIKKHSLMRKLHSVETLGSTSVICTDKTGTLTCNAMTVRKVFVNNVDIDVSGNGYAMEGKFTQDGKSISADKFSLLLKCGVLCNNASLKEGGVIGDPTEGCLVVSAGKGGLGQEKTNAEYKRVDELPFDSERKMMSTVHQLGKKYVQFTKGAPDVLLHNCDYILINGKVGRLTKAMKDKLRDKNKEYAAQALRVLGFAYKELKKSKDAKESGLIFIGLQCMIDPAREGVKEAIASCHSAGIKVVMVTGDYEITAKAIAKELGLGQNVMQGKELERLNNEGADLAKIVEDIDIFARVNPEHKLMIVNAFKRLGHVVAMTGDGVNDAPALKKADIGIAMGITGTDVAKEASAMVLTDDHFRSIVDAVEEGRGIYDNIKKFVNYLLSSNFGEVLVLFVAMLIGFTDSTGAVVLPLLAIQILWLNLVTDGLPALALGVDPHSPKIMDRKPRLQSESIVNLNMLLNILVIGVLVCVSCLTLFKLGLPDGVDIARTMVFTSLVVLEFVRVYMIRAIYNIGLFSNKYLIAAIGMSLLLQLSVIYTPLSVLFKTAPLGLMHWMYILFAAVVVFVVGSLCSRLIVAFTREHD
jgi:P-type Ca2+ transporter type 2C